MKKEVKFVSTEFVSTGLVYGRYWGGGEGAYAARKLSAETKEDLLKQANDGLNGSLDDGMGYESLIGAILNITKITTIEIEGKSFENKEYETEFVGDLTEEQQDFLIDCNYCM